MSDSESVLLGFLAVEIIKKTKKRKERHKSKNWLLKRHDFTHTNLLSELRFEPTDYRNYLRMDELTYLKLLSMVTPWIEKQDTVMRKSISPHERLSATLKFLATGRSYEDLKFSTIISAQALGRIIPETCDVLYNVLRKEYLKESFVEDIVSQVECGEEMFVNAEQTVNGTQPKPREQKRKSDDFHTDVLQSVRDHFKRPKITEDRYDMFGKTVALKIRGLEIQQRLYAEKMINDILFDAELGNLSINVYQTCPSFSPNSISSPSSYVQSPQPSEYSPIINHTTSPSHSVNSPIVITIPDETASAFFTNSSSD